MTLKQNEKLQKEYINFFRAYLREHHQEHFKTGLYHRYFAHKEIRHTVSTEAAGHIYNPNSVMGAINGREFGNYLFRTETYESLKIYIAMDFHGLNDS